LRVRCTELVFLLQRQVLPGFHAPQNLLLALGRHAIEVLQSLLEFLLPLGRKAAEILVVLERLPLLFERLIAMLVQPLAGMMTFDGRFIGPGRAWRFHMRGRLMTRMRRVVLMVLGE